MRIELLRASRDAETSEYASAPDEYVIVLDGSYERQLRGGLVRLDAGMELAFPPGLKAVGKIRASTRLLRALRAPVT